MIYEQKDVDLIREFAKVDPARVPRQIIEEVLKQTELFHHIIACKILSLTGKGMLLIPLDKLGSAIEKLIEETLENNP